MDLSPSLALLGGSDFPSTFQISVCVSDELLVISGVFYLGLGYSAYLIMSIANFFKAFRRELRTLSNICYAAFSVKTVN